MPLVNRAANQPTAHLLTQDLPSHKKQVWMLRSLLEG